MSRADPAHVSGMFDDRERGVFVPIDRVRALGGWTHAIVYSQLSYWYQKMRRPFYKTADSLAEELALSPRTVERALANLRELGVIETAAKKVKGTPVNHFVVNYLRHDELVLGVRQSLSDSAKMAESMDSAKMAESYTGEYIQEKNVKPLSANADFGEESKPSAKRRAPPRASPSVPNPPGSARPPLPKDALLDELVATYNAERKSSKGELPEVRGRTSKLDSLLRRFVKDIKTHDVEPVEAMRILTRYLAQFDHYLGIKNGSRVGTRYGLTALLRNWSGDHWSNAVEFANRTQAEPKFKPGQKLWHKRPSMREREAVTVDRSRAGGKVFVYRGDETSGPMIEVEAAHLTPRGEP